MRLTVFKDKELPELWSKWKKSEFRVLIKHYFLREKTITETMAKLDKYYGDPASSISMVKKWFTEFRWAVQARSMPNVLDAQ